MPEINPTSSVTTWPSSRAINSSQSGKHSPKQNQKNKKDNEINDEVVDSLNDKGLNPKKRSPGSNMNSHIDEYA